MDEATTQELQLASFRLGDNHFVVDIMRIREIVLPQPLAGMPRPSQVLDGMINLRGAVIPVVNLRARFGMEPRFGGVGKLMIISVAGRLVALAVDDVEEVVAVPVRSIVPPPEICEGVGGEYLVGVCLVNAVLYLILDIDALFTPAERRELGRVAGDLPHGHV
jgi:purine-binding chemotaxis protein CheW